MESYNILPRKKEDQLNFIYDRCMGAHELLLNMDYKLIAVPVLKAGSRSLYHRLNVLRKGDKYNGGFFTWENSRSVFNKDSTFREFTMIATCRDPYERAISVFKEIVIENRSFESKRSLASMIHDIQRQDKTISIDLLKNQFYIFLKWIEMSFILDSIEADPHTFPQYFFVRPYENIDHIVKLEKFEEEMKKIEELHGASYHTSEDFYGKVDSYHVHKTDQGLYNRLKLKDWYSPESVELLNRIYFIDFDYFGYEYKTFEEM